MNTPPNNDPSVNTAGQPAAMRLSRGQRIGQRAARRLARTRQSGHRALWAAGPWFATLAAGITLVPFVIYWLSGHWWTLLAVTAVGAAVVFALVYLFFAVVGSLARDDEEKTARLAAAYDELSRYAARVRDDLDRARQVQQRMLPDATAMPLPDRLEWASRFIPESEVGGDYFDAADLGGGRVGILFGDVSGHGMAAAFVTAILKTSFQAWADDPDDLCDFIRRLNSQLCRLTPEDSFAAVFLAVYDSAAGELRYVNGGHYPEAWVIPADPVAPPQVLGDARSTLLGVQEEYEVHQARRPMRRGDRLILATDGLVEAHNDGREMFGIERFGRLLAERRTLPLTELTDLVVREVEAFSANGDGHDDKTILAFRVR